MLHRSLLLVLIPAATAAGGCIFVPTPAHLGTGVITEEATKSLQPGLTTSADVLLRFGNPAERDAGERFFVYRWKRVHGWFVLLVPGTGPAGVEKNHYLVLEFAPDRRLRRFTLIELWPLQDPARRVREWMSETSEPVTGQEQ